MISTFLKITSILSIVSVFTGCAALSSSLGLTHGESVVMDGHLIIVTDLPTLERWREIVNSHKAYAAGIEVTKSEKTNIWVLNKTDNSFSWFIYAGYTEALCHDAETARYEGEFYNALHQEHMHVTDVHIGMLENCKKGLNTPINWTDSSGKLIGYNEATLVLQLRYEDMLHYQYRYQGSRCRDGSASSSSGRGTCSWHGGVSGPIYGKQYIKKEAGSE